MATYKDLKKYRNTHTHILMFSREAVSEYHLKCHTVPSDPFITSSAVTQSHQILSLPAPLSRSPISSSHYQLHCHAVIRSSHYQLNSHAVPSDPLITSSNVTQSPHILSLPAQLSRNPIRSSHYQLNCYAVPSHPLITSSTLTQSHQILSLPAQLSRSPIRSSHY